MTGGPSAESLDELIARMPWLTPGRAASPEEAAATDARRARAEAESRLAPYVGAVPPKDRARILARTLDSPVSGLVRRFVERYERDREAPMFWISGKSGSGKTVACVNELVWRGGKMVSMLDLVKAMRPDAYHTLELAELRRSILRANVLIVDDVGVGHSPDDESPILYDIVNARQGLDALTFFTSNVPKTVFEKYDVRMRNRLLQRGYAAFTDYPCLRENLSVPAKR